MYFLPFKKLNKQQIEYILNSMDNKKYTEKVLANNDHVIQIESESQKIDKVKLLTALCDIAFRKGAPSDMQLNMLSILLQRLRTRLNIDDETAKQIKCNLKNRILNLPKDDP